jgi:hypothetical protein
MSSELTKVASPHTEPANGTLSRENIVPHLLARAMKLSNKTHAQIAHEASLKLERKITPSMLRDFTRKIGKRRFVRFPLAWVPVFGAALADKTLARFALDEEDRRLLELGKRASDTAWALEKVREEVNALLRSRPQRPQKMKKRRR